MSSKYESLLAQVHEIHDIQKAHAVLAWDQQVNMPTAGNAERVHQMAALSRLAHAKLTTDEFGELLEAAAAELEDRPYDSMEAGLIRDLRRRYENGRKLPPAFVARIAEVGGKAYLAWQEAREKDAFPLFQPHLEQVIGLCQEMAELYGYEDEKYDALLDKYEAEIKTAQVRALFEAVSAATRPLLEAIVARGRPVDDAILHQPYDVAKQRAFAVYIAQAVGYDFERGHLGTATHPFASSFSRNDSRITTRWYPDFLNPALFGALHESGHAMYEQGTHPDFVRTHLARGASLGFHESQSRMIENMVGRSRGFWQKHYGRLQETFPDQLGHVSLDAFYRAINKVQPSFIRVEADELTYNFHIILRFELEQAMLNGDLAAADLPEAWNDNMQRLLGVIPPTDREGCLQDIHWSRPSFGYFPTYALGNLYAAQLYEAATSQDPLIAESLAEGNCRPLVAWLAENVHQHGRKYTPPELIVRASGRPLSPDAFISYATRKFSEIYKL